MATTAVATLDGGRNLRKRTGVHIAVPTSPAPTPPAHGVKGKSKSKPPSNNKGSATVTVDVTPADRSDPGEEPNGSTGGEDTATLEARLWELEQADRLPKLTVVELRNLMKLLHKPTAGRKEELVREVRDWLDQRSAIANRRREDVKSTAFDRRSSSDAESLEGTLLRAERRKSRQSGGAASRMTAAPAVGGIYRQEVPTRMALVDEDEGDSWVRTIKSNYKKNSESLARIESTQDHVSRHKADNVNLPKARSKGNRKREQIKKEEEGDPEDDDDVRQGGAEKGHKVLALNIRAPRKEKEEVADEVVVTRTGPEDGKGKPNREKNSSLPKRGKRVEGGEAGDQEREEEILVDETADAVVSTKAQAEGGKKKPSREKESADLIVSAKPAAEGRKRKPAREPNETGSKRGKRSGGKENGVKTLQKKTGGEQSKEGWKILYHKKPLKDWVVYDPSIMRPAPPPKGTKTMKLLSWNVNGLRGTLAKEPEVFARLADEEDFDVICLQETKLQAKDVKEVSSTILPDYEGSFWSCSTTQLGYSGTAVISRVTPISVQYGMGIPDHDDEGRLITVEFNTFFLISSYVPNAGDKLKRLAYRTEEWDRALRQYLKELGTRKPVVLTGDLNCANEDMDIHNPSNNRKSAGFTDEERSSFKDNFLNQGLVDTFRRQHANAVGYTYWTQRFKCRESNKGWRLDYFLVSKGLYEHVHDSFTRPDVLGSDHCPIGLTLIL